MNEWVETGGGGRDLMSSMCLLFRVCELAFARGSPEENFFCLETHLSVSFHIFIPIYVFQSVHGNKHYSTSTV